MATYSNEYLSDVNHDLEYEPYGSGELEESSSNVFYYSDGKLDGVNLDIRYLNGNDHGGTVYMPSTIDGYTMKTFSSPNTYSDFYVTDYNYGLPTNLSEFEIVFPSSYTEIHLDSILGWITDVADYNNTGNKFFIDIYVNNPDAKIYLTAGDPTMQHVYVTLHTDSTYIYDKSSYNVLYHVVPLVPTKTFYAYFNGNGATVSATSVSTVVKTNATKVTWSTTLPTITRSGWNIIGFNTSASSTSALSGWTSGASNKTVTSGTTYYAITKRTLTCYFNGNGATLSSTSNSTTKYNTDTSTTWNVTTPTITRSGWTILGWNPDKNATAAYDRGYGAWKPGCTFTAESGSTYYAITSRTLSVTYNANGSTISKTSDSKTVYNTNTTTTWSVTLPTITPPANFSNIGFNTSSGSTSATSGWTSGATNITVTHGKTYYAITRRSLTCKFYLNGATSMTPYGGSAVTTTFEAYFYKYNGDTSTTSNIYLPSITRGGWTIVGWGTSASSTSAGLGSSGGTGVVSSGGSYYAVTSRTLSCSFNKNGASSISTTSSTKTFYNTDTATTWTTTLPTITAASNFSNVGWATSNSSTSANLGTSGQASISVSSGATYYAITKRTLKVTYSANGATSIGSTSATKTVYNGSSTTTWSVTLPTITRTNGTVIGWSTSSSATSATSGWTSGATNITVTHGKTYYAITSISGSCTFKANGATISKTSLTATLYNSATTWTATLPKITRANWTILGFNTSSSATSATSGWTSEASVTVTNGKTYYAITSKVFSVTFNANGNTISNVPSLSVTRYNTEGKGTTTCTLPTITAPTNFTNVGWATTSTATTADTGTSGATSITVEYGATYYAITKRILKCTFNANGATLSKTSISKTVYNGDSTTSWSTTLPKITRSGWTIVGFNTSASSTSATSGWTSEATNISVTNGKTYYAVTYRKLSVTYNANGNTISKTSDSKTFYNSDTSTTWSTTLPTITAPTNFTNVGFNTSSSSTSATSGWTSGATNITVTSGSTYYAITKRTLSVTFNANGASLTSGSGVKTTYTVYNGSSVTTWTSDLPTISRSGWAILGFATSASATNPANGWTSGATGVTFTHGKTYYAITSKTLNLTYMLEQNSSTTSVVSKTIYNNTTSASFTLALPTSWDKGNLKNWVNASTSAEYDNGGTLSISSDTSIYAVWLTLTALKVSGSWKTTKKGYVKVNGEWRKVTNSYIKVNGSWKEHAN